MGDLYIIVGHYGSGKTEFALSFAYELKKRGRDVAMADLDVVNPYFCSKEQSETLRKAGIEIISNNFNNDWKVDSLSLHAGIQSFFLGRPEDCVVDVGGNAVGARVLAAYAHLMGDRPYEMWMVVNANRYETQGAEQMEEFMRDIERMCGLRINGIINNTHMVEESSAEDVLKGDRVSRELSERSGVDIKYTMYLSRLQGELEGLELAGEPFPVGLHVRPTYL